MFQRGPRRAPLYDREPADAEDLGDVAPVDYYYVTANALEDGACIEFDKLPHLIKKSDTYDLGDLEAWETAGRPMGLKKLNS